VLIPLSIKTKARNVLAPLAAGFAASRISPNLITALSLVPAIVAGFLLARGMVRLGGVFLGISGLFDTMDGLVAKLAGRQTRFGALLDSTIDRYVEIAIFIGLGVLFRDTVSLYGVMLALGGSLMVSYVKARAEGLGASCEVGMLQRPERFVILLLGALLGVTYLEWAIWIIAVLANLTALQRLLKMRGLMDTPGQ
jgi:CDP-diacylglycerol--glycerol-3-phosphate 3-phosphatidyltransferase